jgi:membrane protein YqaA with SNARE-associated domain
LLYALQRAGDAQDLAHQTVLEMLSNRITEFNPQYALYGPFDFLFYPPSFMRPSRDVFNCVHKFLWDNRLEYAVPSLLHVRAYMKVGYNLGGWVGFYFGRWCFRDWLYETTRDQLYIQAIRNAIDDNSLVLVLLLQIAPIMPYSMVCYFFGASNCPFFPSYVVGTAVGVIPCVCFFVFMVSQIIKFDEWHVF